MIFHLLAAELSRGTVRLVNAHLVSYGSPEWTVYLQFRDQLRADPRARDEYAKTKVRLAGSFPNDRASYIDGKSAFVRSCRRSS